MKTKKIKRALLATKPVKIPTEKDWLSTGSALLNCACTDNPWHGLLKGHYYWLVGDSATGKTFLSLTCLAEAAKNPNFRHHRFIFDNRERGALMDMEKFFGKKMAARLEPPREEDGEAVFSRTVEEFYYNLDDAFKDGRPFIYILDSMDALDTEQAENKFREAKKAHRKNKEISGMMGDGKAAKNSANARKFLDPLQATGSILIIISQTRINIGFDARFAPKRTAGGESLMFLATVQLWSSLRGMIKKTVRGNQLVQGSYILVKTKKNRLTGKDRRIIVPIYPSYGIDDIGGCVDWMVKMKFWRKVKGTIRTGDLGITAKRGKLIRLIQRKHLQKDLYDAVGDAWATLEKACAIKLEPRYE